MRNAMTWLAWARSKIVPRSTTADRDRNLTEQAMIDFVQRYDADRHPDAAKEMEKIAATLRSTGKWTEVEEWRVMTQMGATIERTVETGAYKYRVEVSCDGQTMSCRCPNLQKAYRFYALYRHLIIYQFYSIGPPWAGAKEPVA